ncbi:MAG: D-aminoacyl-tRNA deacylase [Eubacterium sp.]|nr:D-aminoacyl-tRNA deacylase [Eubacterium sp.]
MKFVIQRVKEASVTIDGKVHGQIEQGYVVLIGIGHEDTQADADKYLKKLLNLRIFSDEDDKMNLSLRDVDGQLLLISQFTLYGNCTKGNRPSFVEAGKPEQAEALYNYIVEEARKEIPHVDTGIFGADMKVSLVNDGPVTIIMENL